MSSRGSLLLLSLPPPELTYVPDGNFDGVLSQGYLDSEAPSVGVAGAKYTPHGEENTASNQADEVRFEIQSSITKHCQQ